MKRLFCIITLFLVAGCTSFGDGNPYDGVLRTMTVQTVYPDAYAEFQRAGVEVVARNILNNTAYTALTDGKGAVTFRIPQGVYGVSVADRADKSNIFNGSLSEVRLTAQEMNFRLPLIYSRAGTIVFKELYFGGCAKAPLEGTFTNDQYIILHNNDSEVHYLDGLCFGALDPQGASATNRWVTTSATGELIFQDFAPINECVWRFKGSGTDFPLAPGEDVVVAVKGARDFAAEFPLSVNLNKKEYFVCFSRENFPNDKQNPTPGDQILESHILEVPKQTGAVSKDKAFTLAINSPAVVIFRPEEGFDLDAYLADDSQSVVTAPGSSLKCVRIPWEWIIDGVDVFYGSKNTKRLVLDVDAGSFTFSAGYRGYTVHRHLDEQASKEAGYEIYTDTNNSSVDFYERQTQSLHQ